MKNSRLKNPFPSQTFSFKFFRILLLLFLIVPELQGQFVRRFELTESTYIPVDVRTADINDDGLMDILTASSEDDKFAWFQNLGNGSFKQHVLTDQGNNAKSIYEVDLDNDGDLDILTAANSDTKVSWFENLGQNQFGPRQVVAILAGLLRAEPGDMDNDGDMDIVIASYNRLRWLKNQGNGVFGGLNTIRTEWIGTNDFEVFDINNDGFDDVIECTSGSSVKYYENNGTGFSSTTLTSGGYIRTKVADINSDGHMDILAAASGNTFKWFRNNGNGFFDTTLTITNGASGLRDIEFVDFDLDGDQDLVYCTANGQVHQLINDSGSFSIGPFILSHNGRAICADDIAGDIFPEIICARDQSTTEWIERDSVGDYSIKHSLNRNSSPTDAIFFLDLNNDNKVEIISGTNGSAGYSFYGMRYFENLDNLEFGGLESANFQGLSGSNIQWEDMDGDGLLDVFYCKESLSYTNDQLRWQKNLGNGNFGSDSVINFYSKNSKKMRFSDIDKDGDRDLAVMTGHLGEIVWLENDGGLSTPHIIDSNKIGLNFIGFQDLNQDSLEDLVAIRWNQGISKILLYQNLNGTFSNALIIADSLPYVYTVDFSDINNDGYMDIVGAGDGSNNVFWLENDSSGSFFTKHSLTVSLAGQIVKQGVFDVDNDMDDDIIVLSQWDDEVMLFRNNGDGTFQPKEVISNEIDKPQYKPSHFDLDYDGDLDFVIGARLGRIHCFENSFNTRDSILQTICLGDSFLVGNQYFNTPGYYVDSSATQFGGDSVTVFELRVDSQDVSFDSLALCQGDSILISGNYHTSSGNYLDSLLNNSGCDSLANISLSFLPISQYWDTVNLCFGDSFLIGSSFYADSGSVTDTIIDTSFCFINTYQLYILDTSQTNINYDLCQGDSIFLQGGFQTSSGIFYDTTLNQNGCDSIVISHLNYEIIDTSTTLYADSIVANMSNVNYQWFNCNTGTALIGETNKSLEPSSQGVYQVLLTGQYCQDTSACIYFNTNPVGLEALKEEIAYRVDSKNGIVHFFGLDPITQVEIYNVQGQLVFFKETVKSGQVQLPNPGIYMLRLKAENEETLIKAAYLGN